MPIENATWQARVGRFYALQPLLKYKSKCRKILFSFQTVYFSCLALFSCMVTKNMSIITKLPNTLATHRAIKISLLQAYIFQHNYDILCLSETVLNSSIESDNDRISTDRYNLIRSNHSSD